MQVNFKTIIIIFLFGIFVGFGICTYIGRGSVHDLQNTIIKLNQRIKSTETKLSDSVKTVKRMQTEINRTNNTVTTLRTENSELRKIISGVTATSSELTRLISGTINTITGSAESIERSEAIIRDVQNSSRKEN